jgi:hypothetical protein
MKNKPLPNPPVSDTADSKKALEFVRGLQKEYFDKRPVDHQAFIEQYLDRFSRADLRSIGRRILMDIMKRPQIATEAGPEPEPEVPGGAAPQRRRARPSTSGRRRPARER